MATPWSRRDALKIGSTTGSLALAGCINMPSDQGSETSPKIRLESDPVPGEWNVEIDVTISNQFSSEDPARLRISLTNTAGHGREYWLGRLTPFMNIVGEHRSNDARILLYPVHPHPGVDTYHGEEAPAAIPSRPVDGCWRAKDYISIDLGPQKVTLSPQEEIGETYAVLDHPDNSNCLAEGEYRFDDSTITPTADEWGFTLSISTSGRD